MGKMLYISDACFSSVILVFFSNDVCQLTAIAVDLHQFVSELESITPHHLLVNIWNLKPFLVAEFNRCIIGRIYTV